MLSELQGVKVFTFWPILSIQNGKNVLSCARPTAKGLPCRMIPVSPRSSGRSKWVPFANRDLLKFLAGKVGTPKVEQILSTEKANVYTKC